MASSYAVLVSHCVTSCVNFPMTSIVICRMYPLTAAYLATECVCPICGVPTKHKPNSERSPLGRFHRLSVCMFLFCRGAQQLIHRRSCNLPLADNYVHDKLVEKFIETKHSSCRSSHYNPLDCFHKGMLCVLAVAKRLLTLAVMLRFRRAKNGEKMAAVLTHRFSLVVYSSLSAHLKTCQLKLSIH